MQSILYCTWKYVLFIVLCFIICDPYCITTKTCVAYYIILNITSRLSNNLSYIINYIDQNHCSLVYIEMSKNCMHPKIMITNYFIKL